MPAASLPYPLSNSSTWFLVLSLDPLLTPSMLRFRTCTRSCSTAPLLMNDRNSEGAISKKHTYQSSTHRKVSHAAIKTRNPFWINQKQTLDRLVLFPTPLTPTNVMLYGVLCWCEASGEDNLFRMDSRRSVDVFGVSILVSDVESPTRTALLIATRTEQSAKGNYKNRSWASTLKTSNLFAD